MVNARGKRQKGQRFERKVRDQLKRIYEVEKHGEIHRVPMSGASYTKGDVVDLNDNSWCYEAKCQETLCLPEWWRQTKVQSKPFQTPCLVFSSNNRPMYWILSLKNWESYEGDTVYDGKVRYVEMSTRMLYGKLANLNPLEIALTKLDGDEVVIVPNELYISFRKELL